MVYSLDFRPEGKFAQLKFPAERFAQLKFPAERIAQLKFPVERIAQLKIPFERFRIRVRICHESYTNRIRFLYGRTRVVYDS